MATEATNTEQPAAQERIMVNFEGQTHSFPADFTDDMISTALSGKEVEGQKIGKVLHGDKAVEAMRTKEGKLTPEQEHLIRLEGYSESKYSDTKGNVTVGVGQTGKYAEMPFKQAYDIHVKRAKSRVQGFEKLPDYVKQELIQAEYRGDLGNSPKFLSQLNSGNYRAAATEFLDNPEYRDSLDEGTGIAPRMELVHDALLKYADELDKEGS